MGVVDRQKPVRIAVIGDEKAGKTSLVVAIANESFPDKCPPVTPPTNLPADLTPEGVPLCIIDTSSRPEERALREQTCLTADVVVLLFDAARPQSFKKISSYWMPELKRLGVHTPVILVATKIDTVKQHEQDIATMAQPIMNQFRQIETCLECSAKQLTNVAEVFFYALKTVLHPVAPLFDPTADNNLGALKPRCVRALKRVFHMNDLDKDGILSDAELNNFQVHCFSAPLQPEELAGVRGVVSEAMPQAVNARGLTLQGFLFLNCLFIERGRLETVWAILRKYGYSNSLLLNQAALSEVSFSRNPDQVVELTEAGMSFFCDRFKEFDKDGNGILDTREQIEMFSTAPSGPWREEEFQRLLVEVRREGETEGLSLTGFLAKWAYTTANDPVLTLAYIRYLGFEGPAAPLFSISKPRRQERKSETLQRSVLQVLVVWGSEADGMLLPRGLTKVCKPSKAASLVAAGEVLVPGTQERSWVILHEVETAAAAAAEQETGGLAPLDAAIFAFDAADLASFRAAHSSLLQLAHASGNSLPCLLLAVEDGQAAMTAEVETECGWMCAELELQQPLSLKPSNDGDVQAIFQAVVEASGRPEKSHCIPQTPSLKATKKYQQTVKWAAIYLAGGIVGSLAGYVVYKKYFSRQLPLESGTDTPSVS